MFPRTPASLVTMALLLVLLLCSCAHGQFFTKTDKAVPRIGRRMDPDLLVTNNAAAGDIPVSQDLREPFGYLKVASLADIRRWSPMSSLYEGYPQRVSRVG